MTAEQLLAYLTQGAFLFIFGVALSGAIRTRRQPAVNATVFFGAIAAIVVIGLLGRLHVIPQGEVTSRVVSALLLVLPYLQLRMVDDYAEVRPAIRALALALGAASAVSLFLVSQPYSGAYVLAIVGAFVGVQGYCAYRLFRSLDGSVGVTRGRSRALVLGSAMLVVVVACAGLLSFFPEGRTVWRAVSSVAGVACGLGYLIGFAPPPWVLRQWQAPAIRSFLSTAATLPADSSPREIAARLEEVVGAAVGADRVSISAWDVPTRTCIDLREGAPYAIQEGARGALLVARVFREQRALIVDDAPRADPVHSETYRAFGAISLLMAPITLGEQRFGVITAYSRRPSRFTEDDLTLLVLLADEIATVLQRHQLTQAAAHVRAQQEATRLKDEFLSAAAHDLRTPLTVILAQAQLLARRMRRSRSVADEDLAGIDRLIAEAQRMRRLTDDVLDASRSEATGFVRETAPADLVALAQETAKGLRSRAHEVRVVSDGPVMAVADADRIRQVLQNLLDNAVKFSPDGGPITIRFASEGDEVEFTVEDRGIGIPPWDLPNLFQRFYRGGSTGERGFSGMGIGLFLCKRIVEEHGGSITADSVFGEGTRFRVRLPRAWEEERRMNAAAHSRSG